MSRPTLTKLKRENLELKASTGAAHVHQHRNIKNASTDKLMGSGCLLEISGIGGKLLIEPIMISDGLSPETIAAIQKDIKRSLELKNLHKIKN